LRDCLRDGSFVVPRRRLARRIVFGGVPGGLPDSSLANRPWFPGDGSLDGRSVACRFGDVSVRSWFGSAARPAVRPTARLTVRLGGVPGYLPDSSLGSSVACPAACLTAHLTVRFGDMSVRRRVGSATCRFGGDGLRIDSVQRRVGSMASCLPFTGRFDSIRHRVGSVASRLAARLLIRFGSMPGGLPDRSPDGSIRFGSVSGRQRIDSAACRFGGVLPDSSPDDSIRRQPCTTARLTIRFGVDSYGDLVQRHVGSAACRFM
jgi:hypothetical protein